MGPPMGGPPAPMAPPPQLGAAARGAEAERFPLDEEPDEKTPEPSPRVVAPAPMAPPAPSMPAAMPASMPAAMPAAMPASMPAAQPVAAPPRGARAVLAAVVGSASGSFSPAVGPGVARRDNAKRAVDAAMDGVQRSGASFDRNGVGAAALEELVGLGALAGLIDDPSIHEILVHGAESILVDRGGGLAPYDGYFSTPAALAQIIARLVAASGGAPGRALCEGTLAGGVHFTAVLPPLAIGGPTLEIKRTQRAGLTGDQLVGRQMLGPDMFEVLRRAFAARRNIAIVGTSDAGVSRLVSALTNLAGHNERVLTIEGSLALELGSPSVVRLASAPGTDLSVLIAQGSRMRADRLVIDGVRGGETLPALLSLSARNGCVLGVHSAPAGNAFDHLVALARMGGAGEVGLPRVIASSVHVLVRVGLAMDASGKVESIAEVLPDGQGGGRINEIFRGPSAVGQPQAF